MDAHPPKNKFYTITIEIMKLARSLKWKTFWKLTSLGESEKRGGKIYEKCMCSCWNITRTQRCWLASWRTTSCWCVWREKSKNWEFGYKHWMSRSRIYKVYRWAKMRCENPKDMNYLHYGWRWIKFLRNSFEEFYKDMGDSYKKHIKDFWQKQTTLDRIDVNWDYCKGNCRWATYREQMENTRLSLVRKEKYERLVKYLNGIWVIVPKDME